MTDDETVLYIIQHKDREAVLDNEYTGKHKIGISNDPERRMGRLRSGTPHELRLIATVDVDGDAEKVEWLIHGLFSSARYAKEWFQLSEEVIGVFKQADQISVSDIEEIKRKIWITHSERAAQPDVPHWEVRQELFRFEVLRE